MSKSEEEILSEAVKRIEKREAFLSKKFPFECKITYFDADDLSLLLKNDFVPIKRKDGTMVKVAGEGYEDQDCLVLRPEDIVDLMFANQETIDNIFMIYKEFGKIKFNGLTAPGLEQMRYYCIGLTDFITDVGLELKKKHKVERIFEKISERLTKKEGYLYQRIEHYRKVCDLYFSDRKNWLNDMRRLKLV